MKTTKPFVFEVGEWTENLAASPRALKATYLSRLKPLKKPELQSVIELYCDLKSQRPLQKVLNLLEVDKATVEELTKPIETKTRTWIISSETPTQTGYQYVVWRSGPYTYTPNKPIFKFTLKEDPKVFFYAASFVGAQAINNPPGYIARRYVKFKTAAVLALKASTFKTPNSVDVLINYVNHQTTVEDANV